MCISTFQEKTLRSTITRLRDTPNSRPEHHRVV